MIQRGSTRVFTTFALFTLVTVVASLRVRAVGTTLYVDDSTCPGTGSGSQANPFCHIQDAICIAVSGDTVSVAPGIYFEAVRMRPGVSVISQAGAAVTTINALNQPCNDTNNLCVKRVGSTQCSVVTFGSGHSTSTVLNGFTLTGGQGLPQPVGAPTSLAGGGIFIFSSPTILNNVVTNNILSGPPPVDGDMRGAGIYVATGSPIVSGNTITGNRAVPPAGTSSTITFGYGGGVWLGVFSSPTFTNNIVTGNRAGDPNAAFSLGTGGGIVAFGSVSSVPAGQLIDRNLVADNIADSKGGGVALTTDPNTVNEVVVTNNVIVGNDGKNGGGVYEYFVKARVQNNTITGNNADTGAGIFVGQGDNSYPVSVTSNIIEGNTLNDFGTGGGLYKWDLSATFEPTISFNLFFNNEKNHVAGDRSDADTIGVSGNFVGDPRFANRAARDFHLASNSPAIDRATESSAPPVDRDSHTRGVDGNGVPDNPVSGDVDVGAYEFSSGGCTPLTESCDGADNNCNTLIDEGFANTDGDAMADCVDPDDDNDMVNDGGDCAPLNATAFGLAQDVAGLDVTVAAPTTVVFTTQAIGSGTHYEVVSGLVSRLRPTGGFQESFCAASSVTSSPWQDPRPAPPAGEAWYYLVRAVNGCGAGTLGTSARDAVGAGDACGAGIVDGDGDGSPSDLDCDDANPDRAPILPELCDTLDNNCGGGADEGNPGGGQACGSEVGECAPGTTVCTSGSLQCLGGTGPGPELCDGLDNDCNGIPDDDVVDTDHDGQDDCLDGDDDNDMVADGSDCAPLSGGSFGVPVEVQGLDALGGSPTPVVWTNQAIGPATVYDVTSAPLLVPGPPSFSTGSCLGADTGTPFLDTRGTPPAGQGWYYLVRSRNACGASTYGSAARDTTPACP